MKDEIKEILEDNGELMVRYKDNSFECFDTLPKNVVDYITNLQEENERLKKPDYYEKGLIGSIKERDEIIQDYKTRNEKAIEYIKENEFIASDGEVCYFCNMKIIKDLLNILQGSDE